MNTGAADIDVVVTGGGIGGLGNALALSRAGHRVRVLERSPEFGEVGAGLQLAPNATRILRGWGLLDEVVARGVLPRRLVMRDAVDGAELSHIDLGHAAARFGAPYVVIHRSDLHTILLDACRAAGVDLVTSATVTDVENGHRGAVAVGADRRDAAHVVLAADGLGSRLRGRLSADEPIGSGYVAFRGAVPLTAVADLSGLALSDVTFYVGPSCHLVQYPLRGGEMLNQVAVFRSSDPSADELDAAFADTCPAVRKALPDLWRDRWWPMYDRTPIDTWVDRRLALTGDAAHPMLQYLAQGACQALEDADRLARLSTGQDWDAALTGYQQARTVRTARVQRTARAWGELWHCDGLFRTVRNALLADRAPDDYRHVDWLWGARA